MTGQRRVCMSRIRFSFRRVMILAGLAILFVPSIAAKKKPAIGQSGHEIFMDRCSACHGDDGTGNGPAVGSLKVAPADLTFLAKSNAGKFPAQRVRKILSEWVDINAHGSREMPIWGYLFL